ncbi:MAG TPA: nucleotidyl transferase AbiEii/AbiGii toxin family protein [Anaerolineae bacterium]|nr:nucleotidyl transferase AbiEii/AbiGii toxin family protein [Anaerolineae bacterium]
MISNDALRQLAHRYQTTELNVRREYIQHLFLSYFYQQPQTDKIYFKGGTALRVLYDSPRFSEDLDFSSSLTSLHPIEQAVLETFAEIERENISPELHESKRTSGYLAILTFQMQGAAISLQLDVSLREGRKKGEPVTVASSYIPAFTVIALTREQLVEEKINALLTRQKARDFYDLYFILRANLLPAKERRVLPQALKTLQRSHIDFEKELKQFLPKSHWALIRTFRTTLERELERYV